MEERQIPFIFSRKQVDFLIDVLATCYFKFEPVDYEDEEFLMTVQLLKEFGVDVKTLDNPDLLIF